MVIKKFSLDTAYTQGARTVVNYFGFFLLALAVGGLAIAAALAILGYIDFYAFRGNFLSLAQMFHQLANSATGAFHYAGTTVYERVSSMVSPQAAQQFVAPNVSSVDIKAQLPDLAKFLSLLAPTLLILKLVIDMISIGWTKIALSLNANQPISIRYLFSYYYLVPRVFVVNLIVGLATLVGFALLIIPGIFIHQRLRFAKYFVIDKNLGIVKALQASWALTEGSVVHLCGYSVIATILESIAVAFGLLWLFVTPLANQVDANVYRQLVDGK